MSTTPAVLAAAAGVAIGHAILPDHWVPLAVLGRTRSYPIRRVARLSGLAALAHVALSLLLGGIIIVIGLQFRSLVENAQSTIVGGLLVATGILFAAFELTGHGHGHSHDHGHGHDRGPSHDHGDGDDPGPSRDHAHGSADEHEHEPGHDHGLVHDDAGQPGHQYAEARARPARRAGHVSRLRPVDPRRPDAGVSGGRVSGLASVMVPFGAAASPDLTILPVFLAATTVGVAASIGSLLIFSGVTITTIVGLTLIATFGGYQIRGPWLQRWGNLLTALTLVVIGVLVVGGVI